MLGRLEVGQLVEGIYDSNATDYDILRGELHRAGISSHTPYKNQAHHIVPLTDCRTDRAREILDRYNIDLNSQLMAFFAWEKEWVRRIL